ncbi:MAG: LysR family transcriptional regulator [Pseudomonadota bacterium]
MDRLHLMTVFVAVAEEESFAGGGRRLSMSPPAVTRAVAALEARLGVKLLNRTTRYVRVTEAGQRYLDDARRIIGEADEADEAAAGINAAPRGHLAVTAPVMFGRLFVLPGIVDYLRRYPDMEVSAMFLDRVVNLLEEGMDAGVRLGELPDSSMKAIGVGHVRRVVCAAPAYLEQFGTPGAPADLARHAIVASVSASNSVDWKFEHKGAPLTARVKPRLSVTSNDGAIEALRQGFGISQLMSYQVAPLIETGELRALLVDYEAPRVPIHVVHREGRYASAKLRSFVDLMVTRLRAEKSLR